MGAFKLTRIDMTSLLYSLKGEGDLTPLQLLNLSVKKTNITNLTSSSSLLFLRGLNGGNKNQSMDSPQMKL